MTELIFKVPALRIKQNEKEGMEIYLARIKVKQLYDRSAERFDIRKYKRENGKDYGYQRELSKSKIEKIKNYINNETDNPIFPTSIVACSKDLLKFDDKENGCGILTIKPTLYIIDGQHRVEAWKQLMKAHVYEEFEDFELPIIVLSGFEEIDEVAQFHIINARQTRVKTDLAHRHYVQLSKMEATKTLIKESDKWIPRASVIGNQMNEEIDGVWKEMMYNANEPADVKSKLPIGVSAFASSLKPFFNKGKLFHDPKNQDRNVKLLAKFWLIVGEVWPEPFEHPKDYVLMKTVGVNAMHLLLLDQAASYPNKDKLLTAVKGKLLKAKAAGYTKNYWHTKRNLSDRVIQSGRYAAAHSSASGHKQIMLSLLHPET